MYISWAAYYEGRTDASYFNILIPRVLEVVLREEGVRAYDVGISPSIEFGVNNRDFASNAEEICARRSEFHLLFVHADSGGRSLRSSLEERREALVEAAVEKCEFDRGSAVLLSPQREMEAWAIADGAAVEAAFGVSHLPPKLLPRSPKEAERHHDPKAVLQEVSRYVGRRRNDVSGILVRIAQEQDIRRLREARSFAEFEDSLRLALKHGGFAS